MKAKASLVKQEAELETSKDEIEAFFKGVIPDFVSEFGGILADQVKFWRFKNQVVIVRKAEKFIETQGLKKHAADIKTLAPLLEFSSFETDETMQNRWAKLLANTVSDGSKVLPVFVQILNELRPIEAQLLEVVYLATLNQSEEEKKLPLQFSKERICDVYKIALDDFDLILQNLLRLGLCQPPGSTGIMFGNSRVALQTLDLFELTPFGKAFVEACRTDNFSQS